MTRLLSLFLLISLLALAFTSDQPAVQNEAANSRQPADVYLPGQNMINSGHRRKLQGGQQTTKQPDPLPGRNMINSGMRKGIKTQHGTAPNRKQQGN